MGTTQSNTIKNDIRMIMRQERKIDREIHRMEDGNQKNIHAIKNYAKKGNIEMVNALSREYIIYKNNIVKLSKVKGKMSNIRQKAVLLNSNTEINKSIMSLTKTMRKMNQSMGLSSVQKMITDFEIEMANSDNVNDMMDDMIQSDVDEEDQEELVDSVLHEIGLEMADSLSRTPTDAITNNTVKDELEERYNKLLHNI